MFFFHLMRVKFFKWSIRSNCHITSAIRIICDVDGNSKILAKTDTNIRLSNVLLTSKAFYSIAYVALVTPDYDRMVPILSWCRTIGLTCRRSVNMQFLWMASLIQVLHISLCRPTKSYTQDIDQQKWEQHLTALNATWLQNRKYL